MGTVENEVLFSNNEAQVGEKYSCSSWSASSQMPLLVSFLTQAVFTWLVLFPQIFIFKYLLCRFQQVTDDLQ